MSSPASKTNWLRRWILLALLLVGIVASCAPGFDPVSKVNTLRVLAVTADQPYASPGDEVTFSLTAVDALGAEGEGVDPRPLQVLWLGGCVDPRGDQYFLCIPQIAENLAPLAEGGSPDDLPPDAFAVDQIAPTESGVIGSSEFTITLPEDIVTRRPVPDTGPHYGIAYVFFAVCAGTIQPTELELRGDTAPEIPLQCIDEQGNELGPDSFEVGYTQVYAFADGRTNDNPPIEGLALDGEPIGGEEVPTVPRCPVTPQQRRTASCGADEPTDECRKVSLEVLVGDVAEVDPGAEGPDGEPLREIVWVTYFADGGDLSPSLTLVSDATQGRLDDIDTEWTPPHQAGTYSLWAVVRDQRGGSSIVKRTVVVE